MPWYKWVYCKAIHPAWFTIAITAILLIPLARYRESLLAKEKIIVVEKPVEVVSKESSSVDDYVFSIFRELTERKIHGNSTTNQ